ncbi:hypothetical protein [Lewinella cohaerens]|uniref:hypothetical protein n=1 Tax=Lewinella cohaerens TaxID=70995 RepID=UPI00035ED2A0|nr:hypothetical protein [Lewinella cohaerens]
MKKKYILLAIVILSLGSFYAKNNPGSTEAPARQQIENTKEWRESYELERTSPIEEAPQALSPLPQKQAPDGVVFIPRGVGKHFTFNENALVTYHSGRVSGCS